MTLFENFNTNNQTSPHFEKHENYVTNIEMERCAFVQNLIFKERCEYVTATESCHEFVNLVDYTNFLYCILNPGSMIGEVFSIIFLFLICAYMFAILGTTADRYFCPPLKMVSKKLGVSENVAGVTLLAFGNGSPDLFTSFSQADSDTAKLFTEVVGAAAFVTGLVAGVIIAIRPFKLHAPAFLRDILFLLVAVIYVDYAALTDRTITMSESITIISIYVVYITIVILDQFLLVKASRTLLRQLKQSDARSDSLRSKLYSIQDEADWDMISRRSGVSFDMQITKQASFAGLSKNDNLFRQFWASLSPIDWYEWEHSNFTSKILVIMKIPIMAILALLIPAVDCELEMHGWSKLLNCLHIITMPMAISFVALTRASFFGIPFPLWTLIGTVPLALIAFSSTRTDSTPRWHILLGLQAIVGSVFVVWTFAGEIVNILTLIGIVTHLSRSFLGCTVLAWGNSIGDLIANISLAKQGYQKMGFSACFGGPLFNSVLGLGLTYFYKCWTSEEKQFPSTQGSQGETAAIFLMVNLAGTLFALTSTNFVARRSVGMYMVAVYLMFYVYTTLSEFEIIHAYGTDHREDHVSCQN